MTIRERPQPSRPEPPPTGTPHEQPARLLRTWWAPLALAATALLLAGIAAIVPGERIRATYDWPPTAPKGSPTRLWYAPLLLNRQVPDELHATIPCSFTALPEAGATPTMLATVRRPEDSGGLVILRDGGRLRFLRGEQEFASVPSTAGPDGCPVRFDLHGSNWSIRGPGGANSTGTLAERPIVTGLFTGVNIEAGSAPSVRVVTEPWDVEPAPWQTAFRVLALLCATAALLLVVRPRRPHLQRPRGQVGLVDGFVALALLVWWIVGPPLFDDGWVKARQTNFDASRGFSNFYSGFGTDLPLGYWLEWLEHWVFGTFDAAVVLRLPALVFLAGSWIAARWTLRRLTGERAPRAAEWAMGLVFVVNAYAWALTLRPEAGVGLVVVCTLVAAVRFVERPGPGPIAAAALLAALAVSAHPAGLVALAPMLAVLPQVIAWVRTEGWTAPLAIVTSAAAAFVVLMTLSSDLSQRSAEARLARTAGDATVGWRDELNRYLFAGVDATTLRRLSVALMLAAVLGFLLRRERGSLLDLPGASLGLALVLLVATPSKWAWHFGVLASVAAVAVATEVTRVRRESPSGFPIRPLLALAVTLLVIGWAWYPRADWAAGFGLRTLSWDTELHPRLTLVKLAIGGTLLVVAATAAVLLARGGRRRWPEVPRVVVALLVPLAVVPLLVYNVGMIAADAIETDGWTFPRQNIESLAGDTGCGLADDTVVAAPGSAQPLTPVAGARASSSAAWAGPAPVAGTQTFSLLANGATRLETPWYAVPEDGRRVGFYLAGIGEGGDSVFARTGTTAGAGVRPGPWRAVAAGPPDTSAEDTLRWQLVPQGAVLEPGERPDAVQLAVASDASPPHALTVTGAVSYRPVPLESLLTSKTEPPLVWPNLVLFMPCATQPRLAHGVVDVPAVLVAHSGFWPVEFETSSFHGVLDLYDRQDLGGADSKVPAEGMSVVAVDREIPGAALAPAVRVDA